MAFRRFGAVTALVATLVLVTGAAALADQGSGQGQTPRSASLGFIAMSDLTGQLNYVADPLGQDAGFIAHCDGYTSFRLVTLGDGSLKIVVTATCTDQDGNTVYLKAAMTDRGEPGFNDSVCILWSTVSRPTNKNSFIHDHGVILAGNIQILNTPDLGRSGEMLSSE